MKVALQKSRFGDDPEPAGERLGGLTDRSARRRRGAALAAILILAAAALFHQVDRPNSKLHEHGEHELRARNFLREGFISLRFLPIRNSIGGRPNFYLNHPPLLPILVAASMKVWGETEVAGRLVVIICSLLSLWLIYRVVRAEATPRIGLWTAGITAVLPAFAYFGRVVTYEPLVLSASLLTVWFFLRARKRRRYLPALFFSLLPGILSGWPYYFVPPAILIYALADRRGRGTALIVNAGQLALFLGLRYYYRLVAERYGGELTVFYRSGVFMRMSGLNRLLGEIPDFFSLMGRQLLRNFTPVIPLLLLLGLGLALFRRGAGRNRAEVGLGALFATMGILPILAFPTTPYHHEFGLFPLIPLLAFMGAVTLASLPAGLSVPIVVIFVWAGGRQWKDYHRIFSPDIRIIGEAIGRSAGRNDTLLIDRGDPVAFYTGLPTQFFFPGPPIHEYVPVYQPDFVMAGIEMEPFLAKHGYGSVLEGLERKLWLRIEERDDRLALAALLPDELPSGWRKEAAIIGRKGLLSLACRLRDGKGAGIEIIVPAFAERVRLEGYLGMEIHHPSPRQSAGFAVRILRDEREEVVFQRQFQPVSDGSELGWIPFTIELGDTGGRPVAIKLENSFFSENKQSQARLIWGNTRARPGSPPR